MEDGYLGSGKLLLKAVKKYGRQNFSRDILQLCGSEKEAYLAEGLVVDRDFIAREDTYNLKCGGEGGLRGFRHSEESKEKNRKSNKDKKRTLDACRNISAAHKGIGWDPETRETRLKALREAERPPLSEEHKDKISKMNSGRKHTEEELALISAASKKFMKGKCPSSNHDTSQVTCPHCGKIGSKNPMRRWHFNNCKVLKSITEKEN